MSIDKTRSVLKFIQKFQIQVGKCKVPTYKIYHDYLVNTDSRYKLSKVEFFRQFNKYFDRVRHGSQRFYLLNDCFDLSQNSLEKAKRYDEKKQRSKNG